MPIILNYIQKLGFLFSFSVCHKNTKILIRKTDFFFFPKIKNYPHVLKREKGSVLFQNVSTFRSKKLNKSSSFPWAALLFSVFFQLLHSSTSLSICFCFVITSDFKQDGQPRVNWIFKQCIPMWPSLPWSSCFLRLAYLSCVTFYLFALPKASSVAVLEACLLVSWQSHLSKCLPAGCPVRKTVMTPLNVINVTVM